MVKPPPQFDLPTPPQIGGPNRQLDKLEETEDSSSAAPTPYSQSFEEFWKAYPRRTGKGAAYKAWKRLNAVDRKRAMEGLVAQGATLLAQATDARGNFCAHPATWLGQRRFDDEPAAVTPSGSQQSSGWRKPMSRAEMINAGIKPDDMPDKVWERLREDIARARAKT